MSIRKDITVTVQGQKSIMSDDNIYIYQGDKDIDLYFTIIDNRFEFEATTVKKYNFTIRKPDGDLLPETSIVAMADNKAKLTITEDMANELSETGQYDILIHLYDEKNARITIPEISFEVKKPLMTTNVLINSGLVSSAILDDINEKLTRLTPDGKYNRTVWQKGDLITKEKLNKIEYELEDLNNSQIDVTSQLAEKANKNDVAKISSGTPLFATSVAGMTDTTKNYVNTTDGYLYLYSSGSWVKSAVKYQELGLSDGQVTPRKVSFLHVSENLFNKNDNNILTDKRISGSEGGDTATTIGSLVSGFIEIELNKQYAYSFDKGFYGGSCTYALYDNGNNLLELKNATVNDTYATFTVINQNAKKVRVNVSKRTVNTFVFNEGNTLVNYEDYGNACMTINVGLTNKQKEEVVNMVGQNVPNVLVGKKLISDGDSICYGSGFVGGYTKIIAENNNMQYTNYGVSGGTITAGTMAGTSNRHWVCRSIQSMDSNADYILLEGGVNDASMQVTIGEISNGYTATLNDMTFCGAFESMLKQALVKWAGKKIGFIITHHMEDRFYMYREKIILMCEKWGVPYLDLYTLCPPFYYIPELRKAYTKPYTSDPNDSDGWHPNEEGYRKYYAPKIEAWMKTL